MSNTTPSDTTPSGTPASGGPMTTNAAGWFEIYVQDLARARRFYEGVLGRPLHPLPGIDMLLFDQDRSRYGASGALVSHSSVASGGNSTVIYFSCADCAEEESRVAEFGGKVIRPKISIGQFGFVTLARDPDGNLIGLHSNAANGAP